VMQRVRVRAGSPCVHLLGVFDGHGGGAAAEYARMVRSADRSAGDRPERVRLQP
jgi:hypothetical protein